MNPKQTGYGWKIVLGIPVLLLVALVATPIVWGILDLFLTSRAEKAMGDPEVYEPVAKTLALYCQSDQSLFPGALTGAWLPREVTRLHRCYAHIINEERASIEMGGGIYHFGYRLFRDPEKSTPETNVWNLYQYSESSSEKLLYTLAMPARSKWSPETLVEHIVGELDTQLHRHPGDLNLHREKITAYLRCNCVTEARQACKAMLKDLPNDWWVVFVNALLLTQEQSPEQGTALIAQWVKKDESFFRYLDLAYYFHLTQRPHEAAQAILQSTRFNADTLFGEGGKNSECRGYTAAMCAYHTGEYEACLRLCEHLLPVRINGQYAKDGLRALKEASELALHGKVTPVSWAAGILPFEPLQGLDIEKLLGRKLPSPMQTQDGDVIGLDFGATQTKVHRAKAPLIHAPPSETDTDGAAQKR